MRCKLTGYSAWFYEACSFGFDADNYSLLQQEAQEGKEGEET
jgi:hypothetical protein